jgi:hypothetical protein
MNIHPKFMLNQHTRASAGALLIVLVLVLGGAAWQAQAQTPPPGLVPESPDASLAGPHECPISHIAATQDYVRVQCLYSLPSTIIFNFAIAADAAHSLTANRYLTLLNTAYALNQSVYVYYSTDSANNPPGCLVSTCRAIEGVMLQP